MLKFHAYACTCQIIYKLKKEITIVITSNNELNFVMYYSLQINNRLKEEISSTIMN